MSSSAPLLPNGKNPRRSFVDVIPAENDVIDLLAQAADALLEGDGETTERLLIETANVPAVSAHRRKVCGPNRPDVHWNLKVELPPLLPKAERVQQRMPISTVIRKVFARDGYRCRFCEQRVSPKEVLRRFVDEFPEAARRGARTNAEGHDGLILINGVIDHVLPHAYGGTNESGNLVTTCGKCNYGRGVATLEQCGFLDPREFAPILDEWDGLTRLVY